MSNASKAGQSPLRWEQPVTRRNGVQPWREVTDQGVKPGPLGPVHEALGTRPLRRRHAAARHILAMNGLFNLCTPARSRWAHMQQDPVAEVLSGYSRRTCGRKCAWRRRRWPVLNTHTACRCSRALLHRPRVSSSAGALCCEAAQLSGAHQGSNSAILPPLQPIHTRRTMQALRGELLRGPYDHAVLDGTAGAASSLIVAGIATAAEAPGNASSVNRAHARTASNRGFGRPMWAPISPGRALGSVCLPCERCCGQKSIIAT